MNDQINPVPTIINPTSPETVNAIVEKGLAPRYANATNRSEIGVQSQITQTLTTQDMVSIRVNQEEKRLRRIMGERSKLVTEADKAYTEAAKALAAALSAYANANLFPVEVQTLPESLPELFKAFKARPTVTLEISEAVVNWDKNTIKVIATASINLNNGYNSTSSTTATHEEAIPADIRALYDTLTAAETALDDARRRLTQARAAIANLDTRERQARAALTEQALRDAGADALVDSLLQDDNAEIDDDDLVGQLAAWG